MQTPIGPPVDIHDLVPGKRYYAFAAGAFAAILRSRFRGTFGDYYVGRASNYQMIRFHETVEVSSGVTHTIGTQQEAPWGLYLRVWEPECRCGQSYEYYNLCRFDDAQKKEIRDRYILRMRRQYERGLTGTCPDGKWLPRDLVREISLRYLTDEKVNCAKRWKLSGESGRLHRTALRQEVLPSAAC